MRTYADGVTDVQVKRVQYGTPISFTSGIAPEDSTKIRGVYTFTGGKVVSFTVPVNESEFIRGIADTVGQITGATATPLGASINNVSDKLDTVKGAITSSPIYDQIMTIGIWPILIGITIIALVWRWIRRKSKRRRR